MTNAEKYLKDGIDLGELASELTEFINESENLLEDDIVYFFRGRTKPTLTEDERVILRNIREYNKIGRDETNDLYIVFDFKGEYRKKYYLNMFRHLFLFIKERRRIRDKGIIRRWKVNEDKG